MKEEEDVVEEEEEEMGEEDEEMEMNVLEGSEAQDPSSLCRGRLWRPFISPRIVSHNCFKTLD